MCNFSGDDQVFFVASLLGTSYNTLIYSVEKVLYRK